MQEHMQKSLLQDETLGFDVERLQDKNYKELAPYAKLALPIDRVPEDM